MGRGTCPAAVLKSALGGTRSLCSNLHLGVGDASDAAGCNDTESGKGETVGKNALNIRFAEKTCVCIPFLPVPTCLRLLVSC